MAGTFGFRIDPRDTTAGAAQIEGLREVQKALSDLSDDLKNEMKSTHLKAAEIIAEASRPLAPFRTGRLASSVRAGAVRTGGRVRVGNASVAYAGPIHFGWPERRIKPQPFVYEALDPRRGQVAEIYAARLNELITRFGIASDRAGNVYTTRTG